MKFFEFCECKYVQKNLENQKEYKISTHAETLAVQNLINAHRTLCKWYCYPKLIIEFILIKMNLIDKPISLKDRIDAERSKESLVSNS